MLADIGRYWKKCMPCDIGRSDFCRYRPLSLCYWGRYALIMRFLHFENNDEFDAGTHPNPKLRKIFELHNMLVSQFKSAYTPKQEICIDESLISLERSSSMEAVYP